jgi:hypothetical protein
LKGYKRHVRNLIARYGAYPVIWIVGGEANAKGGPWDKVALYMEATDPYDRLMCIHTAAIRNWFSGLNVFDFDMYMSAPTHDSWKSAQRSVEMLNECRETLPTRPVLNGETNYERHMQYNFDDIQRYVFWSAMLSGAAGHTYGAAGIWHMGTREEHGNWGSWGGFPYDLTTWDEGMHFPGSAQLGRGKALLEELPWHEFEPHPEWIGEDAFAAGIPGRIRVIYQPKRGIYNWRGFHVNNLAPGIWSAFYFDPVSGRRFDLGTHTISGTWTSPNVPTPQDWVLVLEQRKP